MQVLCYRDGLYWYGFLEKPLYRSNGDVIMFRGDLLASIQEDCVREFGSLVTLVVVENPSYGDDAQKHSHIYRDVIKSFDEVKD